MSNAIRRFQKLHPAYSGIKLRAKCFQVTIGLRQLTGWIEHIHKRRTTIRHWKLL